MAPAAAEPARVYAIAGEHGLPPQLAAILVRRGLAGSSEVAGFLEPALRNLRPPEELPGVAAAVEILDRALRGNRRIVLYGDYDVDGVASLAFLARILRAYGGRVACFLPMRAEEGYGLSAGGVERCFEEHRPEVLVAVDCGTNSTAEIAWLAARGVEVLVLDHHEAAPDRPPATVVNPKLAGEALRYLCSAGVVFKVVHGLLKHSPCPEIDIKDYLDLVALATVADVVPLVGENRILVRRGLAQIPRSRWPGLRALAAVAGVNGPVRGADVGFRLGPRVNASGRLGSATESLRLLLTDDAREAEALAAGLELQNRERQNVERGVSLEAEAWLEGRFDPARNRSVVAGARDWHPGVLGIVAAKLLRLHNLPAIVVGFGDDGIGKGSCRSVEGFSLVEALGRCAGLLEQFGGHDLAAGLSIREEHFENFRRAFDEVARAMPEETFAPRLALDARLDPKDITNEFLDAQDRLEPFGNSNLQPVFLARAARPAAPPRVLKDKHLKLEFAAGRTGVPAIFFNGATDELPRPPWDVAFRLERNTYGGRNEPQMQVVAIRHAE